MSTAAPSEVAAAVSPEVLLERRSLAERLAEADRPGKLRAFNLELIVLELNALSPEQCLQQLSALGPEEIRILVQIPRLTKEQHSIFLDALGIAKTFVELRSALGIRILEKSGSLLTGPQLLGKYEKLPPELQRHPALRKKLQELCVKARTLMTELLKVLRTEPREGLFESKEPFVLRDMQEALAWLRNDWEMSQTMDIPINSERIDQFFTKLQLTFNSDEGACREMIGQLGEDHLEYLTLHITEGRAEPRLRAMIIDTVRAGDQSDVTFVSTELTQGAAAEEKL